jgi:mannose-6-phosphate isomerase-like protein (cupin superfamily)
MTGPTTDEIKLDTLPTMRDQRGALTVAELGKYVPFSVVRMFYVSEVPCGTQRGAHAHYHCSQYLLCISGRVRVTVMDGSSERHFELAPSNGIYIRPGIFAAETYLDPSTVLLVLCDRPYEKDDYINTLEEFLAYRSR